MQILKYYVLLFILLQILYLNIFSLFSQNSIHKRKTYQKVPKIVNNFEIV